jgi:toxin ParE1/3/4
LKLYWTKAALEDRRAIRDFIAADNPAAALGFDEMLSGKAALLVERPFIGRPGRVAGTRELVAHKNYILIYDTAGDDVRVLRILHAARMWPPFLSAQ